MNRQLSAEQFAIKITWFLIPILYIFFILLGAVNIPFGDDLAILSSLHDFKQTDGWASKLNILFGFHNEHRIAVVRLVALLSFWMQGQHVDVSWWIIIGNSFFLAFVALLYYRGDFGKQKVLFIPVTLLLLQPMHYELMFWGMASLQNMGVLLMAALALYLLIYHRSVVWPLVLAEMAVYTSGNGLLTFAAALCVLLYQRRWEVSGLWFVIGALNIWLYWRGFSAAINSAQVVKTAFSIHQFFSAFLGLIGGLTSSQWSVQVPVAVGLVVLALLGWRLWELLFADKKSLSNNGLFTIALLIFVLLTIAVIAYSRGDGGVTSVSRYKLYSVLTLALVYTLYVNQLAKRRLLWYGTVLFAFMFWSASYVRYARMFDDHSHLLLAQLYNWHQTHHLDIALPSAEKYYSDRFQAMYESGEYNPPTSIVGKLKTIYNLTNRVFKRTSSIKVFKNGNAVVVETAALPEGIYYAVIETRESNAIYPLNGNSLATNHGQDKAVVYSTSVDTAHWVNPSKEDVHILRLE